MSTGSLQNGLLIFVVAFGGMAAAASAADPALERAAAATGAGGMKSIRYAGNGIGYTFGQAYKPGLAWPKIRVQSFVRLVSYETGSMKDEITFARAEGLGGGGYPHVAPQCNEQYVSGAYAWNQTAAGPRFIADRVHQLWITPQGVVKAAIRNNASVRQQTRNGQVSTFADYRDNGGVKFPTRIAQAQGGFPVLGSHRPSRVGQVECGARRGSGPLGEPLRRF